MKDASWDIYTVSFDSSCLNGNNPGTTSPVRPSGESQEMTAVLEVLEVEVDTISTHCTHYIARPPPPLTSLPCRVRIQDTRLYLHLMFRLSAVLQEGQDLLQAVRPGDGRQERGRVPGDLCSALR